MNTFLSCYCCWMSLGYLWGCTPDANLWEVMSRRAGWVGRREADGRVDGALSLLLIYSVSFVDWQAEEVLHCLQISQQRLRGRVGVLLFAEDFWQQPLGKQRQCRPRQSLHEVMLSSNTRSGSPASLLAKKNSKWLVKREDRRLKWLDETNTYSAFQKNAAKKPRI